MKTYEDDFHLQNYFFFENRRLKLKISLKYFIKKEEKFEKKKSILLLQ